MPLLTVQLLFVEREGDEVRLDVIVLARADAPDSPRVGEPLCFSFALPGDESWRDSVAHVLERWVAAMSIVGMDVISRGGGRTLVRIAAPTASLVLAPAGG